MQNAWHTYGRNMHGVTSGMGGRELSKFKTLTDRQKKKFLPASLHRHSGQHLSYQGSQEALLSAIGHLQLAPANSWTAWPVEPFLYTSYIMFSIHIRLYLQWLKSSLTARKIFFHQNRRWTNISMRNVQQNSKLKIFYEFMLSSEFIFISIINLDHNAEKILR